MTAKNRVGAPSCDSLQKQAMDQQSSIARLVAIELNDQFEERKHSLQLVCIHRH
ncbi:hypothetical protein [Rhodoferax saidenbachensis]|uniref:Uncharacterized protein n=1 Tax=Rhodoferax saidenbachensis TaxID=1484693 RepID=A0ABU1ZQF3_9BURK|nr:hypothetical protein [Rhodoferax saidenbachensis]MDR7307782.1 hypothetical protein [Rhodoferax saidenbachensis]